MIAKGRFFCNQILHIPFITNILARFFASKNFKEKSFQNQPLIPWKIANYNIFNCKRTVPLVYLIAKEPSLWFRTARSWIGVRHGISRATGKQHKAMCRACGSAGHWHGLSPELSHHLGASGGDRVVWGNTPGALPHAPVATAFLTAPLFWWHWFLKHE